MNLAKFRLLQDQVVMLESRLGELKQAARDPHANIRESANFDHMREKWEASLRGRIENQIEVFQSEIAS